MRADSPLLWERWDEVDRLLSDALERSPPERVSFVTQAAADDDALRDLVLRLLDRLELDSGRVTSPSGPVMRAAFGDPRIDDSIAPGSDIDRFRVLGQRGRGGMATVYEAERSDGTYQQRVALKVLRRGLDTDDLIRRFLVERQILSSLTHPNIARLLDGGSTPDGRPYLVMELVEGEPITAYADRQELDAAARLRLFLGVADAVHAAHRQLVVHRDIKPSNILVDSDGRVKLLDFGIAKLLEDDAEETAVGARALTPVYASPEQLRGGRITTATDVYQLGLLLRELLTGVRPVAGGTDAGVPAAHPGRQLRGDLDIIVGKALREDPEERYASADEMAADIRRHLRGLPIMAHPESAAYRLRKFIGRHPAFLPAIAALAVGTALFIGTLARHNRRLKQERDAAEAASRLARETQSFLVELFESADPLAPADPERGRNITVVEALQLGAQRVHTELQGQPQLRAELLSTIGSVLEKLDQVDSARSAISRAIEIRVGEGDTLSPAFADDLGELAYLLGGQDEQDSARQLLLRRLDIERGRDSVIPEREGQALMALGMLEAKVDPVTAIGLTEQGVAALRRGGGKMGEALRRLADDYRGVSRTEESEAAAREALAILEREEGPSSVHTAMAAHTLGQTLAMRGDTTEGARLIRRAIAVFDAQLGSSHTFTMTVRNNLGVLLTGPGTYAEAEGLLREVLAARLARFGENNSQVAGNYQNIAVTVAAQGRYREADSLARHAEVIFRRVVPEGSYIIAYPMLTRAEILLQGGDAAGAARVAAGAADILRGKVPTGHPAAIMADCRLGRARAELGDAAGARVLLDSAVQRMGRAEGIRASQVTECRDALSALGEVDAQES